MLSAITYVLLPMPLLFFVGSNGSSVNLAKFLTGFSTIGSIAIPSILKHSKAFWCYWLGSLCNGAFIVLRVCFSHIVFHGDE
ncbi:hypothetical protein AHAS_Ahas12G0148400 [Arachis hypogaea]